MAEENKNKPGFVVHKKQQDSTSAASTSVSSEKKKVVVVKKKNSSPQTNTQPQTQANSNAQKSHVVVKKSEGAEENLKQAQGYSNEQTESIAQKKNQSQSGSPVKTESRPASGNRAAGGRSRTFELNSARPNVKAGNLSDKPKNGFNRDRNNNHGSGFSREGGYRDRSGVFNRDGGSGFNGAQARRSYQNRERENGSGFNGDKVDSIATIKAVDLIATQTVSQADLEPLVQAWAEGQVLLSLKLTSHASQQKKHLKAKNRFTIVKMQSSTMIRFLKQRKSRKLLLWLFQNQ